MCLSVLLSRLLEKLNLTIHEKIDAYKVKTII